LFDFRTVLEENLIEKRCDPGGYINASYGLNTSIEFLALLDWGFFDFRHADSRRR